MTPTPHLPDDPAAQLAALQSFLQDADTVSDLLRGLARVAAEAVHPSAACGITSRRQGRPITVASSDERAERLDETQYSAGEGPCLHALATGERVHISDLNQDHRWPQYRQHALAAGVHGSLSLPLTADGAPIGALNIYLYDRQPVTGPQADRADLLAAQTSATIRLSFHQAEQADLARQLCDAVEIRSTIDRAIGVVVARESCSPDDADAWLQARAASHGQPLLQAAADILATTGPSPAPG